MYSQNTRQILFFVLYLNILCKVIASYPHNVYLNNAILVGHRIHIFSVYDALYTVSGPAFTIIYVLAGLPLARLADTRSRPLVLVLGLAFWSVMVLLTGFATAFWELLVLRIFLGVGEVRLQYVYTMCILLATFLRTIMK